jgi:hypothetical protein
MVRRADNPARLARDVRLALSGYAYDHEALVRYICTNLEGAVPVDLYSALLQKKGRELKLPPEELKKVKRQQLGVLSTHLLECVKASREADKDSQARSTEKPKSL